MSTTSLATKIKTIQTWRILCYVLLHIAIFGHQILYKLGIIQHGNSNAVDFIETIETGTIRFGTIFMLSWFLTIPIFGRLLCGWACHMGALQDFGQWFVSKFAFLNRNFKKLKLIDSKFLRYALPAIVFLSLVLPAFYTLYQRINSGTIVQLVMNLKKEVTPFEMSEIEVLGAWFFVGVIFVGMFGKRPVCRFVCPFATVILRPLQKLAVYKIRKTGECVDCNACSQQCVIGIDVSLEIRTHGYVKTNDCVSCFKCIDSCNYDTLSWGPKTGKEIKEIPKEISPFHQVRLTIIMEILITTLSIIGAWLTYKDVGTIVVVIPAIMMIVFLVALLVGKLSSRSSVGIRN